MSDRVEVELCGDIIVVRYQGRPSEQGFQEYLERYTELVERGVPYAAVYTTHPGSRMPSPRQVRMQAGWMKEHRELYASLSRGLAFHLPSPVMRGVLRGILAIQPLGAQHVVVDTEEEAMRWALARLRAD